MQRTPKQGRKLKLSGKNGVNIRKKSEVSSTPKVGENVESPPWLSDSPCHSSAPSPIPFLCTQDGSSGEHDVVWNYYSPSSDKGSPTHHTPIRKRKKKFQYNDFSPVTRIPMKKKLIRPSLRKKEFLKGLKEELIALNKNVQGLMCSAPTNNTVTSPDADTSFSAPVGHIVTTPTNDDCLFDGIIKPPQELVRDECEYNVNTSSLPLKNNAFDKVSKCDNEGALESDDSMNEFLLKASQMVEEEHLLKMNTNICDNNTLRNNRLSLTFKNKQVTKLGSPKISNDSFENLIGNMNDSEIEFLTQAPPADNVVKKKLGIKSPKASSHSSNSPRLASAKKNTFNFMKNSIGKVTNISKVNNCWNEETGDSILNNISNMSNLMNNSLPNESRSKFGRHKSMPESPTPPQTKKLKSNGAPSSSTFSRHSTMPTVADIQDMEGLSQPMKCTPDEIKKKHQAAREKLMARKQEPGSKKSSSLNSLSSNLELDNLHSPPKLAFQTNNFTTYKTASSVAENVKKNGRNLENNTNYLNNNNNKASTVSKNIKSVPLVNESKLQEEIERKRKEALQKLQMKKALGLLRK